MPLSRRRFLQASVGAPVIVSRVGAKGTAWAQTSASPSGANLPPVILVHGNGDHADLWLTTRWRFESHGVPPDRIHAINFIDPLARDNDAEPQANRSSTEDQRRELAAAIDDMKARSGAARVALVANSRGGFSVRNYVQNGGGVRATRSCVARPITASSPGTQT